MTEDALARWCFLPTTYPALPVVKAWTVYVGLRPLPMPYLKPSYVSILPVLRIPLPALRGRLNFLTRRVAPTRNAPAAGERSATGKAAPTTPRTFAAWPVPIAHSYLHFTPVAAARACTPAVAGLFTSTYTAPAATGGHDGDSGWEIDMGGVGLYLLGTLGGRSLADDS